MRNKDVELAEKLGTRSGEYYSLNNFESMETDFAKKSRFHGQIMDDGFIFNPYIHRRWLPVQYTRLLSWGKGIIEDTIKSRYSYKYSINYTIQELEKLELLRVADREAFYERRRFFTVDVMKDIFIQNLKYILEYASSSRNWSYNNYMKKFYIYGLAWIDEEEIERTTTLEQNLRGGYYERDTIIPSGFLKKLQKRIDMLENADTYYEIKKAIKDLPTEIQTYEDLHHVMSESFVKAFHLAGAYYTLKHRIMFEHKEINGVKGAEACDALKTMLKHGFTAEEFDALL